MKRGEELARVMQCDISAADGNCEGVQLVWCGSTGRILYWNCVSGLKQLSGQQVVSHAARL